jgi:hypothetical protein
VFQSARQDPNLIGQLYGNGDFQTAAGSAILAGTGRSRDVASIDVAEQLHLRKKAFEWLSEQFGFYEQALKDDPSGRAVIRGVLKGWMNDPELSAVRESDSLGKLPDEERREWKGFWETVAKAIAETGD